MSHPPAEPKSSSTWSPTNPTAVTQPLRGCPSATTQVVSNRSPSPARPPEIGTPGSISLMPVASDVPFTVRPSDSTNTPRRFACLSAAPSWRPARRAPPAASTSTDAERTWVRSKRAITATNEPSANAPPLIWPAVEQPTTDFSAYRLLSCCSGWSGCAPMLVSAKARTSVSRSSGPGNGDDQPLCVSHVSV